MGRVCRVHARLAMSASHPLRTFALVGTVILMGRLDANPETWLPELRAVLTACAKALRGRRPNAALIVALLPEYRSSLPGNQVVIEYLPEGYTFGLPEPEYAVSLEGGPFRPSWLLAEVDMHRFLLDAV